ncbi:TPA_asm: hypothetical protein ES702_05921 [Lokiarchaeia virus SkuldV3]|uniref:Tail fiber protein n=1 Tax=Lokiarchaeia virus SkuldV3 TaxID=2983915 RepID=A0A9N6YJT6_9VIRU|nr:hypothetical protein QKT74_gp18 [Lokiarchaeia virus SkuldV3]DAZ90958.1 TPA_asm: hypothetical protein ES702_05921 [Lokiarchaeia virus SkuldV3]
MYSGTWIDNETIPGWYKCDGNNGTVNLVDKFVRGGITSGATGGSDDAVVVEHLHELKYNTTVIVKGIVSVIQTFPGLFSGNTELTGVSGIGANKPAYYTLIFIQRIS